MILYEQVKGVTITEICEKRIFQLFTLSRVRTEDDTGQDPE